MQQGTLQQEAGETNGTEAGLIIPTTRDDILEQLKKGLHPRHRLPNNYGTSKPSLGHRKNSRQLRQHQRPSRQ